MSYYDTEDKEFPLIPTGIYTVALFNVTCDLSKKPPTVLIQYKLENNRRVFQHFRIDEKSKKWITWQMGILGLLEIAKTLVVDPDKASDNDVACSFVNAAKPFIGGSCEIEIKHDTYQDKTREKVYVASGMTRANEFSNKLLGQDKIKAPDIDANESLPF